MPETSDLSDLSDLMEEEAKRHLSVRELERKVLNENKAKVLKDSCISAFQSVRSC